MKLKSNKPILLIEDNPMDVDLTIRAFKKRNVTNPIQIARNGEEAISWVDKWDNGNETPVVILLDLKLPRIDGLDVLKIIKTHSKYRTLPIVVLTTSNEDKDIKNAYEFGANSFIVKPVNFEKFIEVAAHIELYWNVLNEPPV